MRPTIGIGDLLSAWKSLGCDLALLHPLGRAFGLTTAPIAPVPEPASEPPAAIASPVVPGAPAPSRSTEPTSRERVARFRDAARLAITPLQDEDERRVEQTDRPVWLTGKQLPAPTAITKISPAPLFTPRRERALLAAAGRLPRAEGTVDLERLVEHLACRESPRALPRRRILSLRGGVQLIVDRSEWMAPFAEDVAAIRARLRQVTGEALDELSMDELPPEVQRLDQFSPRPWAPPPRGTAIVVVTDLGRSAARRGERAPKTSWAAFLHQLAVAGFAPVAIVPGRTKAKRDPRLPRAMLALGWDRSTRVAEVTRFRKAQPR